MSWQGAWLGKWAERWNGQESEGGGTYADAAAVIGGVASATASIKATARAALTVSGGGQMAGDLQALGVPSTPAHTSGGGGGVQSAQRRRLRERAQEEEEIAMVLTVLAQIGVFA